jgi:V8-like Glu-specific endopeptidase
MKIYCLSLLAFFIVARPLWSQELPFANQTEVTNKTLSQTGIFRSEVARIGQFKFDSVGFTVEGFDVFGKSSACSGYLLTNSILLTAAHCFSDMVKNHRINPTAFKENFPYAAFFRQRMDGIYLGKGLHMIRKVYIPKGYFAQMAQEGLPMWKFSDEVIHDYAIVHLDNPVRNLQLRKVLPLELTSTNQENLETSGLSTLGYPGNRPEHTLWLQVDCVLNSIDDSERVLTHQCDTYEGQSGSPLFIKNKQGAPKLVGVLTHSGGTLNYGNYFLQSQLKQIQKWVEKKGDAEAVTIDFSRQTVSE